MLTRARGRIRNARGMPVRPSDGEDEGDPQPEVDRELLDRLCHSLDPYEQAQRTSIDFPTEGRCLFAGDRTPADRSDDLRKLRHFARRRRSGRRAHPGALRHRNLSGRIARTTGRDSRCGTRMREWARCSRN
jgi:hypothetical protein